MAHTGQRLSVQSGAGVFALVVVVVLLDEMGGKWRKWRMQRMQRTTHAARRTHAHGVPGSWIWMLRGMSPALPRRFDWLFGRLDLCFGLGDRGTGTSGGGWMHRQIDRYADSAGRQANFACCTCVLISHRRGGGGNCTSSHHDLVFALCLALPFLSSSSVSHPRPPRPPRFPAVVLPRSSTFQHACCIDEAEMMSSSIASSEGSHYTFKALTHVPRRLFRPPTPTVGAVRSFRLTPCFQVTLEDVINAKHLPPLGRKEFEEYLLFKEYSIENL